MLVQYDDDLLIILLETMNIFLRLILLQYDYSLCRDDGILLSSHRAKAWESV